MATACCCLVTAVDLQTFQRSSPSAGNDAAPVWCSRWACVGSKLKDGGGGKMLPVPWLMPSVSTCKALHPHLLIVIIRFIYFTSQLHDFYTSSFSVLSAVRSEGQGRVSLPLCSLSIILPLSYLLIHQTPTESLRCVKYHAGRWGRARGQLSWAAPYLATHNYSPFIYSGGVHQASVTCLGTAGH